MAQRTNQQDDATATRDQGPQQTAPQQGGAPQGGAQQAAPDQTGDQARRMETAGSRLAETAEAAGQAQSTAMREQGTALREGGEALRGGFAEAARAAQRTGEQGGQVARGALETVGETTRQVAETGADQFERMAQTVARAARDAAENARLLTSLSATTWRFGEVQQATAGFFERLARTNAQAMQAWIGQAGFGEVVALQQRLARDYLKAATEGGTEILRATERLAQEASHPLERQAQRFQQEGDGQREGQGEGRGEARGQGGGRRDQDGRQGGRQGPKVSEFMSTELRTLKPDDTIQQAARLMGQADTGVLPVVEDGRVVGLVTDRDVAIRIAAEAKDAARTPVREAMSKDIAFCCVDEEIDRVVEIMEAEQIRRMPVLDRHQKLVGIVSIGDLAERSGDLAGRALSQISRESGRHSQRVGGGGR
jgi:CBS domain-containing protein